MNWLLIAISAHFLFAVVFIVDKFILSKTALEPAAYAFYVGLLGIVALALAPFDFALLPVNRILISFLAGFLFVLAIFCFYQSVQLSEISRLAPMVGGMTPIFTLFFSYLFLAERLTAHQFIAFFLLVIGGVIMLWPRRKPALVKAPFIKKLFLALLASLFFAGSFVISKFIYTEQTFINGFIWIRIGGFLGAWLFLFWPEVRQSVFRASRTVRFKVGGLAAANKGLSALSTLLLNYAIALGSVTLVNALQGIQYVFLLIIAFFLSRKFPRILKEQISNGVILGKIAAICLIGLGLAVLAF
jgi:uncharacterized membrane protein